MVMDFSGRRRRDRGGRTRRQGFGLASAPAVLAGLLALAGPAALAQEPPPSPFPETLAPDMLDPEPQGDTDDPFAQADDLPEPATSEPAPPGPGTGPAEREQEEAEPQTTLPSIYDRPLADLPSGEAAQGLEAQPAPNRPAIYDVRPEREKIGRIYQYIRSNRDGTLPERISVFRKDRTHIEVFKSVRRCTNAALVTAELDLALASPVKITGGRLRPNAVVQPFAFLTVEPERKRLDFVVDLPEKLLEFEVFIDGFPWHLFDFDLASLTVQTPYLVEPKAGFSFDVVLTLADPDLPQPIAYLGKADLTYVGEEQRGLWPALRFAVGGEAFGRGGTLWLHARDGHIVDVELDRANHLGYEDFKLELQSVNDGGEEIWRSLLIAHFEGCPAP